MCTSGAFVWVKVNLYNVHAERSDGDVSAHHRSMFDRFECLCLPAINTRTRTTPKTTDGQLFTDVENKLHLFSLETFPCAFLLVAEPPNGEPIVKFVIDEH